MSDNLISPFERLPVELLHRIFDNLDTETILFSVRPISRLFQSIVNTYDRYILNLNLISKSNFYIFSRLINPENVISLILSNDNQTSDQIDLFISFDHLQQFIRLHSLSLFHIDELQLQFILQQINLNYLTSFSLSIREYHDSNIKVTIDILTSLINRSSLQKIELNINNERLSWPSYCTIQYLIMNEKISLNHLIRILECSPYLHHIVISEYSRGIIDNLPSRCFEQVLSLTIGDVHTNIDEVEALLLMTPELIYLKLIGGKMMMNGQRWEQFIIRNLIRLNKFEFYFCEWALINQTPSDLELILSSFQTPFWIENKQWFVICEYDISSTGIINLYTIPICRSYLIYEKGLQRICLSTFPKTKNEKPLIMNNITSLDLIMNKSLADDIQEKKTTSTTGYPLFPKVTEINLHFREDWPLFSLQLLSKYINILQIIRMTMHSNYFNDYNENIWIDICIFLKQAYNLSQLSIQSNFDTYHSNQTIENISSIIPYHIKHFEIAINNLKQINMIFERCENLSTIKFDNYETKLYEEVIQWFNKYTINSTCRESHGMVSVWIGKKNLQLNEIQINYKRIKRNDIN